MYLRNLVLWFLFFILFSFSIILLRIKDLQMLLFLYKPLFSPYMFILCSILCGISFNTVIVLLFRYMCMFISLLIITFCCPHFLKIYSLAEVLQLANSEWWILFARKCLERVIVELVSNSRMTVWSYIHQSILKLSLQWLRSL